MGSEQIETLILPIKSNGLKISGNTRGLTKQELNSCLCSATQMAVSSEAEESGFVRDLPGIGLDQITAVKLMHRQDTKYILPSALVPRIFEAIAGHYRVQEIGGLRLAAYETIYYDSSELRFFHDHINGKLNRCKVRRRTYSDCDLHFLEVKSKTNRGRTIKKRIQVGPDPGSFSKEASDLVTHYSGTEFRLLTPRLLNRFRRSTLVNHEMTERVTVDFNLNFVKYEYGTSISMDNLAIIEIKQEKTAYSFIREVLKSFRIKKTGLSKYCLGIALTGQAEKVNLLKHKIRQIQKIISNEYVA